MIGVVAHDAGGAEIISSYTRQQGLDCIYCLEGPARSVFARKIGQVDLLSLGELVAQSDWILCGTSFLSDLEWRALGLAKAGGKHSIAALDHWVNYRQRFFRHGDWHFPDEIWVGDKIGESLARKECPGIKTTLVPNPYFLDIQRELAAIPKPKAPANGLRILYVSEPLREDGLALHGDELYWGYTEEDALRYFLSNVHVFGEKVGSIVIRPHPQEEKNKYDWAGQEFDLPIVLGQDKTLLEQIVASDVVVGCATMAMVVGLLAGKRVISCIPPDGKAAPLPQPEIEEMQNLIACSKIL
jgi:hypothetical protein